MKIDSIYIVDDDSITLFGLRKILQKLGNQTVIEEYRNGRDALDALLFLQENQMALPEIIFLDINMPIMDGWAFLEEFSQLPYTSKVHINIVTSSIDVRDRQKWKAYMKKTGHQIEFITKPIYELSLDRIVRLDMVS
ncbi:MAG: response regulator [Bacteroidota bacterium]